MGQVYILLTAKRLKTRVYKPLFLQFIVQCTYLVHSCLNALGLMTDGVAKHINFLNFCLACAHLAKTKKQKGSRQKTRTVPGDTLMSCIL